MVQLLHYCASTTPSARGKLESFVTHPFGEISEGAVLTSRSWIVDADQLCFRMPQTAESGVSCDLLASLFAENNKQSET